MVKKIKNIRCKFFGHAWIYKDFTNAIKSTGGKYNFTKARKCKRCEEREYLYAKWVSEEFIYSSDRIEAF